MKRILIIFVFLPLLGYTQTAPPEVKPLTNTILMVHFDDGYARHHRRGEPRSQEYVVLKPLDVTKAMLTSTYSLQSPGDAAYSAPLHPVAVGRKSKPTEFGLMCQTYESGCINTDPDHALEHWVYMTLPHALKANASYTLTLDDLSEQNTFTFTYQEPALHSEAIHVNNIGYAVDAPAKYAYLYHWMGDQGSLDLTSYNGKNFKLYDVNSSQYVFTGTIAFRKGKANAETAQAGETPQANFSAADVYECDFSSFKTAGTYKVVVEGIGSSFPFVIDADAYHEAFYWTMKGLYQNRSGVALTAPYTDMPRAAPHNPQITPGFAGRLKYSTFRTFDLSSSDGGEADRAGVEAGYKGTLENTFGWYQDAGDWDGYYTHSHVPAYLMFLYEAGKAKFTDGELNIPESGNGVPDLLDEAAWLLRYFKRAKDEVKQKGWGTGGVPGARVFGDLWGSDTKPNDVGQGSWEDTARDWYVLGEDPWTTYKYAALTAQLAYILEQDGTPDPEGVNWRQEAVDAYAWASAKTTTADEATRLGYNLKDMRLYAAAALYRLTGESQYHRVCFNEIRAITGTIDQTKQDQMFGVWMYLLAGNRVREEDLLARVNTMVTTSTEKYLLQTATTRAARWGGDFYFPMLVGHGSTPMVQAGVYGYLLKKNEGATGTNYLKHLHTTADYFLGCNPLNMTWISGVAERHPTGLFHLDWWYSDKADPLNSTPVIKGVVPYGPWRYEYLGDLGWWNPNWAYSDKAGNPRIYPASVDQWPGHERWFDMRVSPLSSEYTIHQNTVVAAFVYGFLTAGETTTLEAGVVTGLQELPDDEKVAVYPNPARDSIHVAWSKDVAARHIEMLTVSGKRMKQGDVRRGQLSYVLDTRNCDGGIYFLKIRTGSGMVISKKVVIER